MPEELERDQFDDLLKKSSEKLEATPSKNWHTIQTEEQERSKQQDESDNSDPKKEDEQA